MHRAGERLNGKQQITDDDLRKALPLIDIGALKKASTLGSNLRIDLQWFDPTRELVEESTSVV